MQVFNPEFTTAVLSVLNTHLNDEPGSYLTREQVCFKVGVDKMYMNAISIVMLDESFNGFETVKSRGIRKKKVVTA